MKTRSETQDICAEILHDLRQQMGISKAKMADRVDVDARTYTRYEAGESAPTLPEFIRMLELVDAPALPVRVRPAVPEGSSEGAEVPELRQPEINRAAQRNTGRRI